MPAPPGLPPIDLVSPRRVDSATFAAGCFWDSESRFGSLCGVLTTTAGFAAGTTPDPTCAKPGDHVEAVLVTFDPSAVAYEELLEAFWRAFPAHRHPDRPGHRPMILTHDTHQQQLAEESKEWRESLFGDALEAEIRAANGFLDAPVHHQKRRLRGNPELFAELCVHYPDAERLCASTAAARINGFLGGHGSPQAAVDFIRDLGLSPAGSDELLRVVRASHRRRGALARLLGDAESAATLVIDT